MENKLVLKNGDVLVFGELEGGHKFRGSGMTMPVIYPDEEFDFPVEEDYDDSEDIEEPEPDDMVPVYPMPQETFFPTATGVVLMREPLALAEDILLQPLKEVADRLIAEANMLFVPTTKDELEMLRRSLAEMPAGLKAVIYHDLYKEGLRVTDVESTDKKVGAAEKYIKEFDV